jgi:hypothetical protein
MKKWARGLDLVNLMWMVLVVGAVAVAVVPIALCLKYDDSDQALARAFDKEAGKIEQDLNVSINTKKTPLPCGKGVWNGEDGRVFFCEIVFPSDEPYGLYQVTLVTQESSWVYRHSFLVKKPE